MTQGTPTFEAGPPASPPSGPTVSAPPKRSRVATVLLGLFLLVSLLANGVMLVAIVGLAGAVAGGGIEDLYYERTVESGPASHKIAVIRLDGVIYDDMVDSVRGQVQKAARDKKVKAVILRINSPGGGLSASDVLHNEIRTRLKDAGKPVVAAMDSVAASGGYYVACAADEIIAQETTVTGSIGVIAQFFFIKDLLKDKLGVVPVTLKMGEQKDWPNLFSSEMTAEQSQYILETLLRPGYERFVDVVARSRRMDRQEVLKLATGRIFMAPDAKAAGLIDDVGYFSRAVEVAKQRAGLKDARVVEYVQPFSLFNLLGLSSKGPSWLDLKPEKLASLASPKVMYLWTGL